MLLNDVVAVDVADEEIDVESVDVPVDVAVALIDVDAVDVAVDVAVVRAHPKKSDSRYMSRALLKRSARLSHLSLSAMIMAPFEASHLKLSSAIQVSTRVESGPAAKNMPSTLVIIDCKAVHSVFDESSFTDLSVKKVGTCIPGSLTHVTTLPSTFTSSSVSNIPSSSHVFNIAFIVLVTIAQS